METPDDWAQGPEITEPGSSLRISGDRAVELGLARHAVQDFSELKQQYGLEGDVLRAEQGWADYLIQALAVCAHNAGRAIASPAEARQLLGLHA